MDLNEVEEMTAANNLATARGHDLPDAGTAITNVGLNGMPGGYGVGAIHYFIPSIEAPARRNAMNKIKSFLIGGLALILPSIAMAQPQYQAPLATYFLTASQTIQLPYGWHEIDFDLIGPGGASGCGGVITSGTAISGGSSGGTAIPISGKFLASQVGNATQLTLTISSFGASCVPSGTTSGSSGSTPTAGGSATTIAVGTGISPIAYPGGAGTNGTTTATAGGGGAGFVGPGGGASGATAGVGGAIGGSAGGVGANGTSLAFPFSSMGGTGGPLGAAGVGGPATNYGPGSGGSGGGLAATPVAVNGGLGNRPGPFLAVFATAGVAPGGNGGNAPAVGLTGSYLTGAGGGGGASSSTGNGGAGGNASGCGSPGGGGGSALAGNLAGAAGASSPGCAVIRVF